ncbi:unnamed protein product [Penicillium salamii]|nr:unnamed protein product [Penicillium salamii]
MSDTEDDPVVASYDVFLTDSDVSRYVFQYLDRHVDLPYNDRNNQCPISLKMKQNTGLVEVEVPISTRSNYDVNKGMRYGEAVKKSRSARDGGSYGMSGGFTAGSGAVGTGGRMKTETNGDVEVLDNKRVVDSNALMRTQALAGRVKPAEEGDPIYMLGTFKDSMFTAEFNFHFGQVLTTSRKLAPLPHFLGHPIPPPASPFGCARRDAQGEGNARQKGRRRAARPRNRGPRHRYESQSCGRWRNTTQCG